jgi:YtkA-like
MRKSLLILLAALAAPATATAGGWATVGLSSLPEGLDAGEPWTVDVTVLQHGRTPLEGIQPAVIVRKAGADESKRFPARPTERPGVYRATVVFDAAGEWRYRVDDDFSQVHDFAPVQVGEGDGDSVAAAVPAAGTRSAGGDDDGPDLLLAFAAAAVAGLAAGLAAAAIQRRRSGPAAAG